MPFTLKKKDAEQLCQFVDERVRAEGCDHTHRFAEEWAENENIDWADLLDILEANGAFCDCEVVLNLPFEDLELPPDLAPPHGDNRWLLPPGYQATGAETFKKWIVCQADLGRDTQTTEGEILVPAPKAAKPRKRMRKFAHFFVGCSSGMPTEVGVVRDCPVISAKDFAEQVAKSAFAELANFGVREAAFVLSKVATLAHETPVGTDFPERIGIASRHWELAIHRVIFK
jgi:hypothetical protein